MLYQLMRSKEEAGQGKVSSASPASPSTMESQATVALSVASTMGETSKRTNNQMPWSDTTYFIIFPSRLITGCLWSRPTVSPWGGS